MESDLDLFSGARERIPEAPLAERMRPRELGEVIGQSTVRPGSPLFLALDQGHLPSLIFWGPPGTGKTSLARILAQSLGHGFATFSAVLSGVKEVREAVAEAKERGRIEGRRTVLFVDEIHRFNRAQQDAFLPHVEDGTIILMGATTENPSFHVNAALLSRCLVVVLEALDTGALVEIARRALGDEARGLGQRGVRISEEGLQELARTSHGDARSCLVRLEAMVASALAESASPRCLELSDVRRHLTRKPLGHDRGGDQHFDLVSALHKSIRGGDPQAATYWATRMLAGGEDRNYLARRLIRIAVEDVGLADPAALQVAASANEAWRFLGSPEGDLALIQAAIYLATAPKSNSVYLAYERAQSTISAGMVPPVPMHLRNAPTPLMKQLGHGRGYLYPHDYDEGVVDQAYLPADLGDRAFYEPSPYGHEKEIARRIEWWNKVLAQRRASDPGARA